MCMYARVLFVYHPSKCRGKVFPAAGSIIYYMYTGVRIRASLSIDSAPALIRALFSSLED